MIDLVRDRTRCDGYILYIDDETARILVALLTVARPRGQAESKGLRVCVEGPAATPVPPHVPVDGSVG